MHQVNICVRELGLCQKDGPRQPASIVHQMLAAAEQEILDHRFFTVLRRFLRIVGDVSGHLMPSRPQAGGIAANMANTVVSNDAFAEIFE